MNWSKIKSIMIYFLILINIFLLVFFTVTTVHRSTISDEVLEASLEVMKKEGFECDKQLLPTSHYTLSSLAADFYSAASLSDLFFNRQLAFRTVENSLVANEDGATLTLNGNQVTYESANPPDATASPGKIKRALKKLGIDMSGAVYDEESGYFYYMYKNYNLFNMFITAKIDSEGEICYIRAQWPSKISPTKKGRYSFIKNIMNLKKTFPEGGKIKEIEAGYTLQSANGTEKYVFSPAWRVNVDGNIQILK